MNHKSVSRPFYLAFPKASLVLTLLIMAVALIGAQNLYFRGDYKVFFEETDPQRMAFEEMQNVFNKTENVAFMVVPNQGDVFNKETLNLVYDITEAAWQLPLSTRVDSIANYQNTYDLDGDLIVEDLLFEKVDGDEDIARIKQIITSTPELNGRLVSKDGSAFVVDTTIQLPEGDQTKAVIEIADAAEEIKARMTRQYPDHEIYLTGMVIMNDAFAVAAQNDAETLIPAMFLLIFLSIAVIVRSIWSAVFTMVVVVVSISITVGLTGWVGIYLSTATVNAPTMITTLAVADCIHFIVGVKYFLGQGLSNVDAIQQSSKVNRKPILITSITTAIGFLMLNFSAVPVIAHLGNMTAVGVMIACVLSLTVLPSMLLLKQLSANKAKEHNLFAKWGEYVVTHHKAMLILSVFAIAIISAFAVNNRLNDVAVKYFDERSAFRQAVDVNESTFGGMSNIDFVIYTDEPYGITKAEFLNDIALFSEWLSQRSEVNHVLTFTDTLKRLNKNMNEDNEAFNVIPNDPELASQYLLLYEMSLPFGLDLGNQIDIDKSALRVIAVIDNLGSNEITQLEKDAKAFYNSLNNDYRIEAASPPLMFAHIGERNMKSMVLGSIVALILISGLILFALRSLTLGVVSLVTNLLPAAVGFGVWGLISGEINMALSVVISMTMGIIVDDTVHFLSKYQTARNDNKSSQQSIIFAFSSVGMALMTTTIVLTLGFAVLATSSFMLNAHMGTLTIIIIVAALIVDFVFLPALLVSKDKNTEKNTDKNVEQKTSSLNKGSLT
ncbi:efflux RND transporter permease subunit [Alteromonas sp. A081]|uniref:efflux RND transporter permease subunit n=1 Tax=Alteromonas sp. A081 TaxID=3410269 RepID=UPI003B9868B9